MKAATNNIELLLKSQKKIGFSYRNSFLKASKYCSMSEAKHQKTVI